MANPSTRTADATGVGRAPAPVPHALVAAGLDEGYLLAPPGRAARGDWAHPAGEEPTLERARSSTRPTSGPPPRSTRSPPRDAGRWRQLEIPPRLRTRDCAGVSAG